MENVASNDTACNADPPSLRDMEGVAQKVADRIDEIANGRRRFIDAVMGSLDLVQEAPNPPDEWDTLDILAASLSCSASSAGFEAEEAALEFANDRRNCIGPDESDDEQRIPEDPYWEGRHAAWRDLCTMHAELPPRHTWLELMDAEAAAMPPPDPELLAVWRARPKMPENVKQEFRKMLINDVCLATVDNPEASLADRDAAAKALGRKLRLLTPDDCEAAPGREYLAKGLLARGDFACVIGAPGSGKSVVAPHLAYCVAQGVETFGRKVRQADVFYVPAEDTHGMRQRTRALKLSRGDAKGFRVVDGLSNLLDAGQRQELLALVAKHRPGLIVVDTLVAAFPGINENESHDMSVVVAMMRALTRHDACVVLIHHVTKADDATPRGHSVLNGALDVSIHLGAKDNAGIIRGKLIKNCNGPCDANIAFRIDGLGIGEDEDGEPITAPICREVADAPKPARLPVKTSIVRDIAAGLIAAGDGPSITRDELRAACIRDDRICSEESRETRTKATKRHYEAALAFGALRQDGERVFCPGLVRSTGHRRPEFPVNPPDNDGIPT